MRWRHCVGRWRWHMVTSRWSLNGQFRRGGAFGCEFYAGGRGVHQRMASKRLVAWLRARLTIRQYVSLHLLVGLALCAVALIAFNELVEEVIDEQEFTRIDLIIANELHDGATPGATQFLS